MPRIGLPEHLRLSLARLVGTTAVLVAAGVMNGASPAVNGSHLDSVRCELGPPSEVRGLESCLARSPRDVELLLDLGAAYEAAGRSAEALAVLRRAVDADPHDAGARVRLGMVLRQEGDHEGARRAGAVAGALRPHDPVARKLAAGGGRSELPQ
jgi:tetratricopeptide (TPR) repeat protein